MKNINLPLLSLIFLALTLSGCASTIGSQNTQFVSQPKLSNKASRDIVICRPSAFYHGLNSMGVLVNSSPSFDLGSGERVLVAIPIGDANIEFKIPSGNYNRYSGSLKANIRNNTEPVYVIVGNNRGGDQAAVDGLVFGMFGMLSTSTTWRAQVLSKDSFDKACGVESSKTKFITDKSLI
jgi:hypothetical protein